MSSWFALGILLLVISKSINAGHLQNGPGHHKAKFSKILSLIFYNNALTTNRRSTPIPQLSCTGGSTGCKNTPATVHCRNIGEYDNAPEWDCKADLPKGIQFGNLNISCEGYDGPDDPYILVGSCALAYTLENMPKPTTFFENLTFLFLVFAILSLVTLAAHFQLQNGAFWEGLFAPGRGGYGEI